MAYEVLIVSEGYSRLVNDTYEANCSCTLLRGKYNVIVDTMTPWDGDFILKKLEEFNVRPDDIHFVISTHGHSDHLGNNNLFLKAKHIVGHSVSFRNVYYDDPFVLGCRYEIDGDNLYAIATPGHTLADITVIVNTAEGQVGVTGDLFEKESDLVDESVWMDSGSENPSLQKENRLKLIESVDWIIPGHGPRFRITEEIRKMYREKAAVQ